jgi:3'(2'), 5'-bisphosphate nucleotidase
MIRTARAAAELVLEIYHHGFTVDHKGPDDPVTDADRQANDLICSELAAHFPDIPIVAEESEAKRYAEFRKAERVFFVDPIDGTREFVAKNGEFAVMIGLLDGDRATHGVIHAPASGNVWVGQVGQGAFRIDRHGIRSPICVSARDSMSDAIVVASRSDTSEVLERVLQRLGAAELITLGSAGLKAASVAEGRADVYAAPHSAGKRWDACAPDAIVTAAGGCYSTRDGARVDYRGAALENDRGIVATTLNLHARVLEVLREQISRT